MSSKRPIENQKQSADQLELESLRDREAIYRTTFDAMGGILFVVGEDWRIILCNEALHEERRQHGRSDDPVGGLVFDLLPTLPSELRRTYEKVFATGKTVLSEDKAVIDGKTTHTEASHIPVKDRNGRVYRVITTLRDVTALRQVERELRASSKLKSVGRLTGGLAHTFNNLLTVIKARADLAWKEAPSESSIWEDLKQIIESADRAEELILKLLAFSSSQVLEQQKSNLGDLLVSLDCLFQSMVPPKVELTTVSDPETWTVMADKKQLEQVFLHLVVNAIDAMPDGGRLTIKVENKHLEKAIVAETPIPQTGDFVCISVSDTGTGMNAEVQQNLFEPFFTTKEQGKGTGLGLSMVYGTIRQHRGHIVVESIPGFGTTFRIYLPRDVQLRRARTRPTPYEAISHGRETILVVEDEPQVRRVMVRILKWLGYTILEAANGEEALQVMKSSNSRIDMLLTDVIMPEMGGLDLAEHLVASCPETPILFVSGYPKGTLTRDGELETRAAFLKKPFNTSTLASKVREVLDSCSG